jgi:hypothetical protein
MIIAISGKIGSGKDTFASLVMKNYEGWVIKKWAGKLKETASLLTGVDIRLWEDQEFKKKWMGDQWGMTYREFLQRLGTEAMRNGLHTDVWVNALISEYKPYCSVCGLYNDIHKMSCYPLLRKEVYPNWLITDTRFPNEADAIKNMGYPVVRIVRPNSSAPTSDHPSETSLDDYTFDEIIVNDGTVEELEQKAINFINKYVWQTKGQLAQ